MKHIGMDIDSTTTHVSVFSHHGREIMHTKVATRKGNRYLKNVLMTAAATIAGRSHSHSALSRMWQAGIAAGVPADRMKRNLARKVAVLAQRCLRFKEGYDDDRIATRP